MTATPTVLLNAQIYVDSVDLTGTSNKVGLTATADELDATTFGSAGFKEKLSGLIAAQADHSGFMAVPDPDSGLFSLMADQARAATIAADVLPGSVAYGMQISELAYAPLGGGVGEIAPISGSLSGDSPDGLVRGRLLLPKQSIAGTVNGAGFQMGAVTSGESLFAAVHVFTAGTTASVKVQSSVDNTFASPTTRLSQTVTALSGFWLKASSAVTDQWWRVRVDTVTGTFAIAALVAIQ